MSKGGTKTMNNDELSQGEEDKVEHPVPLPRKKIFLCANAERDRQDKKWGADVERIPSLGRRSDGSLMTCEDYGLIPEEAAKILEKTCREHGNESLAASAVEELAEAISCGDDEQRMRGEVLQLLAICVKWIEAIERRGVAAARGSADVENESV